MCDVKLFLTFTSLNLVLLWQLVYLCCSSIVINTVIVTAGTFESIWKREVWRFKIWFNPPFLQKCLYQVRVITVFTVFRLLIDCVCLYTYEFWLSLCKIARSSVIVLLPLFTITMPNVTAGGKKIPGGHCNLVALLKHLWITKLRTTYRLGRHPG